MNETLLKECLNIVVQAELLLKMPGGSQLPFEPFVSIFIGG